VGLVKLVMKKKYMGALGLQGTTGRKLLESIQNDG